MQIGIAINQDRYVDKIPPSKPTGLTATAGNTQVSLDWDDNESTWEVSEWDNGYWAPTARDLAGYNVYVDDVKHNAVLIEVSDYIVTGLTNGTLYSFSVTAVDNNGNESAGSTAVSATPTA